MYYGTDHATLIWESASVGWKQWELIPRGEVIVEEIWVLNNVFGELPGLPGLGPKVASRANGRVNDFATGI